MTDIRIYDFEFNLLCIMTDSISSEWHLLYNGVGTYEGHFRLKDEISDIILSNKYIVIVQGNLQAICTGRIVDKELTVCGRTVNWILTKRVRPPFKTSEIFGNYRSAETILLYCLKKGFKSPPQINADGVETDTVDYNKAVSNFRCPDSTSTPAMTSYFWRNSANDLEAISVDLCNKLNRGHRVVFDVENKLWRFEFIYPRENNVLISKESITAYDFEYIDDILSEASGGWYPDSTDADGETNWVYIRSQEKIGIYDWDCVLSSSGKSEAVDELVRKSETKKIQSRLRNLKFGVDYNLGDVVPVYYKYGGISETQKYIVNGINIKMTASDSYEEPVLKRYDN